MTVLQRFVETYWEGLHPRLDPADGNDPTMRVNILATLAAPDVLSTVRATPLISSRTVGRFSYRDVERPPRPTAPTAAADLDGDDRGRRNGMRAGRARRAGPAPGLTRARRSRARVDALRADRRGRGRAGLRRAWRRCCRRSPASCSPPWPVGFPRTARRRGDRRRGRRPGASPAGGSGVRRDPVA